MNLEQACQFYERSLKPILFKLDPEQAHTFAHTGMPWLNLLIECGLVSLPPMPDNLRMAFLGSEMRNPIGLAAGFDKNGTLLNHLNFMGFGFAEVGSITARASIGNPRPRLFRLPGDQAIINFMGLNGDGASAVSERLKFAEPSIPYSINIAKTNDPSISGERAVEDILTSFKAVKNLPAFYIAINVSCPNTQEEISSLGRELASILDEVEKENQNDIPILIKLSPDSDDKLLDELLSVTARPSVAGYICGNTSMNRSGLLRSGEELNSINKGGMSGAPLKSLALNLVHRVEARKDKDKIIVACGGIGSGADAYEFIAGGASAFQIYSSLIYQGPLLPYVIAGELSLILERHGQSLEEAVGSKLLSPVS